MNEISGTEQSKDRQVDIREWESEFRTEVPWLTGLVSFSMDTGTSSPNVRDPTVLP